MLESRRSRGSTFVAVVFLLAAITAACSVAAAVETDETVLPSEQLAKGGAGPISYPPDNMWAFLASAPGLQRRADSLEEATDFAELVIVGRYVGVERGGVYGADATAVALIDVDSVAKGAPRLGPDGLLRVEFILIVGSTTYPEKEFADLERSIPKDPALLYLFTWGSYLKQIGGGLPEWEGRGDLGEIYKTIGGDGAMRVVNGRMEPPPYVDGWPTTLRASAREVVLERIATAGQP